MPAFGVLSLERPFSIKNAATQDRHIGNAHLIEQKRFYDWMTIAVIDFCRNP
jgi:hypothetical protein